MKAVKLVVAAFFALSALGQNADVSEAEKSDLRDALGEAGNSSIELIRNLEKHLSKYPDSSQKAEIERTIAKSAMEVKDNRRTLLYGERILEKTPDNPILLERVTRILLENDDRESAEKALKYARKFEAILRALEKDGPERSRPGMADELDRALSRGLVFQSRATGNLGKHEDAIVLARKAYVLNPSAEAAREAGRWLVRSGRDADALQAYADAFAISDPRASDEDRAKDRTRLRELYTKLHGSEAGLGDQILKAYDRTVAAQKARLAELKKRDPNHNVTDPMEFTITGLKGQKLELASLKGKVVVMDFWATWCGPCRAQHPLYEQVKQKFKDNGDVTVLSINTDEEQSLVEPFLVDNKWTQNVYFEDGLSNLLKVSSIPTTIVIDRKGRLYSRMNGFLPDRFVAMLTERIEGALEEK